jgi:hypothetical protein
MAMMMGLNIGLSAGRTGTGGILTPAYTNYWTSQVGDPTLTGAVAGRLLVAVAGRTSMTPATADAGWTIWGSPEVHGTAAQSIAVYTKVAAGSDTITWTNAVGVRSVWEFSNAAKDTINGSQGATTTVLNYEAQPTMAATGAIVGVYVIISAAQTATSAATAGLGYTQRSNKNTSLGTWAGDSNTTLVTAFDPANGTFDTSGNWTMIVFTVKGAG